MATREFTAALARLADEGTQVVTRSALLDLNFTDDDIGDGFDRSLLAQVFAGTYVIGRSTLTQPLLRQAATLHGKPAMLLGRSAAEHRELISPRDGVVTVGTARRGLTGARRTIAPMASNGLPGLVTYRGITDVYPESVDGVATSPVPRMLVDIAAAENDAMLERVWAQSDYRRLLDLPAVDHEVRTTSRAGVPAVRRLLHRHPGHKTIVAGYDSSKEVDFLQLIADAGLPIPAVSVPMLIAGRRYIADFFYALLGLVVELDDPSHDRTSARESDALRDADFYDAGLDVIRFDTRSVAASPSASMLRLAAKLAHCQRQQAGGARAA